MIQEKLEMSIKSPIGKHIFKHKNLSSFIILFILCALPSLYASTSQKNLDSLLIKNPIEVRNYIRTNFESKKKKLDPQSLLILAKFYNQKNYNDSTIQLIESFSLEKLSQDEKFQLIIEKARAQKQNGNYQNAIEELLRLEKTSAWDSLKIGKLKRNLADVYFRDNQYSSAIANYLKAIEIFRLKKDSSNYNSAQFNLGNIYMIQKEYEFAEEIYLEFLEYNKKNKNDYIVYLAYFNYLSALISQNKYKEGEIIIHEIEKIKTNFENKDLNALLDFKKGELNEGLKNYPEALMNYQNGTDSAYSEKSFRTLKFGLGLLNLCLKQSKDELIKIYSSKLYTLISWESIPIEDKVSFLELLLLNIEKTNLKSNMQLIASEFFHYSKTLEKRKNNDLLRDLEKKYQTQIQLEKNEKLKIQNDFLKKESRMKNIQVILIFIVLAMLTIVSFLIILNQKNKLAFKNKIITIRNHTLTTLALENSIIKNKINELKFDNNLSKNDKKEIQKLIKTENFLETFSKEFKAMNPDFENKLINDYPSLTKSEIQFLRFIRTKMTYKQIAEILNISHTSVISKSYRIRKKLNTGEEKDIYKIVEKLN